jgi:hypothetical protein
MECVSYWIVEGSVFSNLTRSTKIPQALTGDFQKRKQGPAQPRTGGTARWALEVVPLRAAQGIRERLALHLDLAHHFALHAGPVHLDPELLIGRRCDDNLVLVFRPSEHLLT